jgi:acyl-CoA reductase-like NAD-dependent aldehyde dehydrogenase
MSVMKDESFGPVIEIMKVKNDEEAIQLMQDTEYGLTASVYSSDKIRAQKILKEINAGTGYWNCCSFLYCIFYLLLQKSRLILPA